jgi:hypothetical protein
MYRYFSLFFFFRLALSNSYVLSTKTEQGWANRTISKDEARQLLGGEAMHPPAWDRFGIVAGSRSWF